MSKSAITLTAIGVLLLALLILTNFGRNLPAFLDRDPVFTERIPSSRPARIDRRLLARFEGQSMDAILETIAEEGGVAARGRRPRQTAAEAAAEEEAALLAQARLEADSLLYDNLPQAPLPFTQHAAPEGEAWLRQYVADFKRDVPDKPSSEELWRFHLALAALAVTPEQLPASLRDAGGAMPAPESDTFPIRLLPREIEIEAPFAVGAFGSSGGRELIDRGGLRRRRIDVEGGADELHGLPALYRADALVAADFDGDGLDDLYLVRGDGAPDSLLRNLGDGLWEDVTIERGLLAFRDTAVTAWIDYDGDGLLDLIVGSRDQPLELYRQSAGGTFQPVAWDLGLWVPRGAVRLEVADLDGDGYPDFHVGIDGLPDRLYLSRPAEHWGDWRFEDIAPGIGGGGLPEDFELRFADIGNSGSIDLAILPLGSDAGAPPQLHLQTAPLEFGEFVEAMGLAAVRDARSMGVFDIDNDGYPDLAFGTPLLSINRVFWNRDGIEFREISAASGGSYLDAPVRMIGADLEGDGVFDLLSQDASGSVRWLVPTGPLMGSARLALSERRPGTEVRISGRDADWIVRESRHRFGMETTATVGVGEIEAIERLEAYLPGQDRPFLVLEDLELGEGAPEIRIALPKRPRERVHRPVSAAEAGGPPP